MEISDTASSTIDGRATPTHSNISDDDYAQHHHNDSDSEEIPPCYTSIPRPEEFSSHSHFPRKDETFLIRSVQSNLVISQRNGLLCLVPQKKQLYPPLSMSENSQGPGSYWKCVENKELWFGFCNSVSANYIGHNNRGKVVATASKHKDWECFSIRPHPWGGYILMVKWWNGFRVVKTRSRELVLGEEGEEGTPWEFIRVTEDEGV